MMLRLIPIAVVLFAWFSIQGLGSCKAPPSAVESAESTNPEVRNTRATPNSTAPVQNGDTSTQHGESAVGPQLATAASGGAGSTRSIPGVAEAEPPLFAAFPKLKSLPFIRMGQFPTPIERLAVLGKRIDVPQLYVKREDLAADPYGGNKVRKLEFLLAQAVAEKKRSVVTFGAVSSNHALATALMGQRLHLRTTLLLLPQPRSEQARHHLLAAHLAGAELRAVGSQDEMHEVAQQIAAQQRAFIIPSGGTSTRANLGFVDAAFELARQVEAGAMPMPDVLYVPMGTMGTAIGISIGLAAADLTTLVRAVRISSTTAANRQRFIRECHDTLALIRATAPQFPAIECASNVEFVNSQLGRGYGIKTAAATHAQHLFEDHTQLQLDPTYTAKAAAALLAARNELGNRAVLYWHTYDARRLDVTSVNPDELPAQFQGYLR